MSKRLGLLVFVSCVLVPALASAQTETIYITPTSDGLEVYIAAAIVKKKVPVRVSTVQDNADLTLKASEVEVEKVSTGAKWVNCLFAYCAGNGDKGSTSVQLVDREGIVLWSYSVNKGRGEKNKQSLSEAIAKHLHNDFFKKRRTNE